MAVLYTASVSLARLRYELRILGVRTLLIPPLITLVYLGFSAIAGHAVLQSHGSPAYARYQEVRGLLALLENGLPLGAGLVAAATIGTDPALELHLALARRYRGTGVLRLALGGVWALVMTVVVYALLVVSGYWPTSVIAPLPQGELIWLSPLLVFVALGSGLALLLRSRTVSSSILALLWIAQFLFKPLFESGAVLKQLYLFLTEEEGIPPYWLTNRLVLATLALVLFCGILWLLGRNEILLGAET